jgi:RNA polymerase sigma-70 factor (ECF subfamily)
LDRDSIVAQLEEEYPGLLSLIRAKTRDEQVARDILNQALVTALEHLAANRLTDTSQIAAYVYQVAMNHYRNHRRKMDERRDRRADSSALEEIADEGCESQLDQPRLVAAARSLLSSLPTTRDREIIMRFYLNEEDKPSICRSLGLNPLQFDKVLFRARQRMRTVMDEKGLKPADFLSVVLACCA